MESGRFDPAGDRNVSYKILLIDHDESRVARIQRPLAEAGYDVVVASAAEEAMHTFEKVRPDLAVIEALLPVKTGSQLCQEIKENPLGKEVPVILVLEAGEDQKERARSIDLHGCDMLIDDAIPDDDLLKVLDQFLREKEQPAAAEPEEPVEAESPAPTQGSQPDMLLDSYELCDALQKLDSILDKQQAAEEGDGAAPLDGEKVREAEQAGDFSRVAEEMSGDDEKITEETDEQAQHEAALAQAGLLADAGQDIDDRLDSIFSMGDSKPVTAETNAPIKFYEEIEEETSTTEESVAPPVTEMEVEEEPEMVAEPAEEAVAMDEPAEELVEPSLEIAPQEAMEEPVCEEAAEPEAEVAPARSVPLPTPIFQPAERGGGMKKWWLVAAAVAVVVIGGGAILLFTGDSSPEPVAITPAPAEGSPAGEGDLVASAAIVKSPVAEADVTETTPPAKSPPPAPKPEPVKSIKTAAPKPRQQKTVAKVEKPVVTRQEPKPEPVKPQPKVETVKIAPAAVKPKSEPKPEPEPVKQEPAPEPIKQKPAPEPVRIAPAAVRPEPKPEPVKPQPQPEPVKTTPEPEPVKQAPEPETVKIAPAKIEPKPEPVKTAPMVYEPPEVIERIEPVYPRKALKRAAGRTIILKLLISESGRIIRVTVEQGVLSQELEAASINAVLRWRYRPATENGVPVKAWTTAEFSF
jgi:TonB family protein